jgi:3-oxoacyl-[acyl-carrier protein] reductase
MSSTCLPSPLAGKVALVTGASRGIGAAIARRLAGDGALVLVHYATSCDKADAVVAEIAGQGGHAFPVRCDLAAPADIAAMFGQIDQVLPERTGTSALDILVNNAAVPGMGLLESLLPVDVDRIVDANIKGTFFVTQAAVARLRDNGRIVTITSLSAVRSNPAHLLYTATKGALNSLTLALAQQLGPRGITVNTIMPGLVETDMSAPLAGNEGQLDTLRALTALGRLGQPEDIADAVALLVSSEGRWITGQWIAASGGLRL